MNRFAIELYFDLESKSKLVPLWDRLQHKQSLEPLCASRGYIPHISLLVAAELAPEELVPIVREFANKTAALDISLSYFGMFKTDASSSLWFGPNHSPELKILHQKLYSQVQPLNIDWLPYYAPEYWVPHCGILANRTFEICVEALRTVRMLSFHSWLG